MFKVYEIEQIKKMVVGDELFVYCPYYTHSLDKYKIIEVNGVKILDDDSGFLDLTINDLISWFENGYEIYQEIKYYHN